MEEYQDFNNDYQSKRDQDHHYHINSDIDEDYDDYTVEQDSPRMLSNSNLIIEQSDRLLEQENQITYMPNIVDAKDSDQNQDDSQLTFKTNEQQFYSKFTDKLKQNQLQDEQTDQFNLEQFEKDTQSLKGNLKYQSNLNSTNQIKSQLQTFKTYKIEDQSYERFSKPLRDKTEQQNDLEESKMSQFQQDQESLDQFVLSNSIYQNNNPQAREVVDINIRGLKELDEVYNVAFDLQAQIDDLLKSTTNFKELKESENQRSDLTSSIMSSKFEDNSLDQSRFVQNYQSRPETQIQASLSVENIDEIHNNAVKQLENQIDQMLMFKPLIFEQTLKDKPEEKTQLQLESSKQQIEVIKNSFQTPQREQREDMNQSFKSQNQKQFTSGLQIKHREKKIILQKEKTYFQVTKKAGRIILIKIDSPTTRKLVISDELFQRKGLK
eukprot:403356756